MAWITCCPSCRTTFRVTSEQLTQAGAWLRCSQCERVFDSTGLVVGWPESLESNGKDVHELAPSTVGIEQPQPKATGLWAATLMLLCVLPALLVFQQRQAVVNTWPALWTTFGRVCAVVRCELPALMRAQDVVIDTSSFVAEGEGYALTAVLRNVATWPVRPASLELTLLNAQDQAVLRRVMMPEELRFPSVLESEQTVDLRLFFSVDVVENSVTGYRLRSVQP